MAKLYWRVKKNGKWTFVAAVVCYDDCNHGEITVKYPENLVVNE